MPSETNLNLYESYAQDCVRAADRVSDPQYRELLLKLASEWMQAAARQASTQTKPWSCGTRPAAMGDRPLPLSYSRRTPLWRP